MPPATDTTHRRPRGRPATPADLVLRWAPIPGTAQETFFNDDTPEAKLLFAGGYGSGKTTTLVAKMLKLSALNAPLPGIVTVPDFGHFEDTLLPAIAELDPATGLPWFLDTSQFYYSTRTHVFDWVGGGPWHVQSAKYTESIKGPQRAWGAMDEPGIQAYDAYRVTVNRIRHPMATLRQFICSGTPEGLGWLMEVFGQERDGTYYRQYRMRTDENVELLKWQPGYVQQVAENATERELRAYLGGEFVHMVGAVAYPSFGRDVHWREDVPVQPHLPLRISFDFNVDPMACVIGQVVAGAAGPELHVVDAVIQSASWTPEVCNEIVARYGVAACRTRGYGQGWPGGAIVYGDSTGNARTTVSQSTNFDLIRARLAPEFPAGFSLHPSVTRANPLERERLSAVNTLLRDGKGRIRLWVRKTKPEAGCATRDLVRSLELTLLAPGTQRIWKTGRDTTSHAGDALGYLVCAEFPTGVPRVVSAQTLFGGQY